MLDPTSWIPDSRYWVPDCFVSGACIPDSKGQNSAFHEQKLHGLAFLYSLCLTLNKKDITLRGTLIAGPKSLRIRES